MRVNIEWLRDWVDVDVDAEALAEHLTLAGLEVDEVAAASPALDGVVVARVESVEPHPDADRLSVATVDDGAGRHRVVCGAPNVAAGIVAPFARVGASLPDGRAIEAAELRGVASDGMLCSARELGLGDDTAGLLLLDDDARPGTPIADHLKLDDRILDIDLTPNRGDCFSILGVAREIAARRGERLPEPEVPAVAAVIDDRHPIELDAAAACPRFVGRIVRGIESAARTPDWMRERLRRAGLRPIHPVVDVTNYVMLELGQPLHAYDLDKLRGTIRARLARERERLTLLDGRDVELDAETLVIADDSGAVGMAGIMGGAGTAVDASTRHVLLESAWFAPKAILGRARRYGLHTDASVRFERGVDPAQQARAIERATDLLCRLAGGRPGPTESTESAEDLPAPPPVTVRHARVQSLLGVPLSADDVEALLGRLGMQLDRRAEAWTVRAPSYRFDIAIEEDVIEEVGRMFGYDNVPTVAGAAEAHLGPASELVIDADAVADWLAARGYSEVVTYSFVDERLQALVNPGTAPVRLANPISSDLGVMRRSLWPGLLRVARQNLSRQQARLRIFEIGPQFRAADDGVAEQRMLAGLAVGRQWPEHWDAGDRDADFFDVKGDLEALLAKTGRTGELRFVADEHPALRPGQSARIVLGGARVGWLGVLHPRLEREFDLTRTPVLFTLNLEHVLGARVPAYRPLSRYPSVRRDLAVIVDEALPVAALIEHAEEAAGELLQKVEVFDLYRGESIGSTRKSIGLGLILQSASRTLTDEDADRLVQSVVRCLERELGATIRT